MQSIEIRCKNCGKKLLKYEKSSTRKYKSPVKKCKKCGTKYADPRCHEIALEGIPEDTFNIPIYVIMVIIGALILYRGIHLFGVHQLGVPDAIQWLLPAFFSIIGVAMLIGSIVEIIAIKSGIKAKKYEKLRKESEERLSDKSYVYILQDLGYKVPEKYL
ncbi:MAG: hypothetical protein K2K21_15615 [Lachnospiraceae bacterium]|nr:hypothetical protein [Lachnospiraceae bacterium]